MRMSVRPKGKVGVIFLILAIVLGVVVTYFTGTAHSRSALKVGYMGNNGWASWSGRYELLDGRMKRTLHFSGTEQLTLETKTESGTLSVEIKDAEGRTIFSKSDTGTASYIIAVDGDIVVTLTADSHCGSFVIE